MRELVLVVVVAIGLSGCSSGGAGKESVYPGGAARSYSHVIVVGDSIMHHAMLADQDYRYDKTAAALLLNKHGKSVHNLSQSGKTMRAAVADDLVSTVNYLRVNNPWDKPGTAVILQLGFNDWYVNFDAATYEDHLRQFVSAVTAGREVDVTVFCMVPTPTRFDAEGRQNDAGATLEDFRQVVRKVGGEGLCESVETSSWYKPADVYDTKIFADGIHLNVDGHRTYAKRLMKAID